MKILITAFALMAVLAKGATIPASSPLFTDVQKAANSAVSGDIVTVPAGAATWTSMLTLSGKAITLQGAGVGVTTITDNSSGQYLIDAICSASNFVRITGFTFVKSAAHGGGMIVFESASPGGIREVSFRFDNNKLLFPSVGGRGIFPSGVFGLIDHNLITVIGGGSQQTITCSGSSENLDGGFTPWKWPLMLGTVNAVYVEDNTFDYTKNDQAEDAIDAGAGARVVVRHNNFLSISQGFHGTDSGNRRSAHSFEIYDNHYTNNSTNRLRYMTVRGGTGVVFNNVYDGSIGPAGWNGITLQYYRAWSAQSMWQQCNGTVWQLGSADPASTAGRTCSTNGGYGFSSTDGETVGKWGPGFTRGFDGTGSKGYPGRDQPGVSTGQVSEPIYTWNNGPEVPGTWAGGDPTAEALLKNFIQIDRDYILKPRPGYTPLAYPHPLISQVPVPPVVVPPAGAKITASVSTISADGKSITTVITFDKSITP